MLSIVVCRLPKW